MNHAALPAHLRAILNRTVTLAPAGVLVQPMDKRPVFTRAAPLRTYAVIDEMESLESHGVDSMSMCDDEGQSFHTQDLFGMD